MSPLPIPTSIQCYFNDSDLAWLFEPLLHLLRDIFLSHRPCFHLTHHSNHFNKTAIMLKRGPGGPDDIPINKAHRIKLGFCTSGSEDTGGKWERKKKKKLRRFKRGKQIQMKGVFLMLANIRGNSSFKSN